MSRLTDKIDINLVEEEIVDIEEIKCKLNERIIKNDILRRESKTETSDATFDSDKLVLETLLSMGASINKNNKLEYKITFDFYKKQMEQKIMKIVDMEE